MPTLGKDLTVRSRPAVRRSPPPRLGPAVLLLLLLAVASGAAAGATDTAAALPAAAPSVTPAAPTSATATLVEWGAGFEKPALSGGGVDAAGKKLALGHLELAFTDGRLVPVRVLDRTVGVFFAGHGSFRYVSTDAVESATYRGNVKRVTPYEVDDQGGFGDAVTAALVMVSPGGEALLQVPAAGPEAEPSAEAFRRFSEHLAAWAEDRGWRYDEVMPQAMLDPPRDPMSVVQIDAVKLDLLHVRDTLRHQDEDIFKLQKSESLVSFLKRRRYQEILSEQPIGRKRLDPRPVRFRLTAVDAEMVNPDGLRAEVTVRQTIEARLPLKVLDLLLDDEWIGPAGATGSPVENDYTVKSLTDGAGTPLRFRHAHNSLLVELPRPLQAGEKIELKLALSGDILFRPGNDNYWDPGDDWFPRPPGRDMEAYTYHVVARVKKPFVAFSSGKTVRRWDEDTGPALACAEFQGEAPLQGPALLAGKYTTYSEERDGLTVRVSAYAHDKPDAMKKIAGLAFSFVAFYKPLLGDYPWTELNIIEINDYGFGVAPPGIIYITSEAFVPTPLDGMANIFIKGINSRIAHEVAHAWWGNATLLGPSEENWMWEATADYYAAFAMGTLKDKGEFEDALRAWKRGAKESASKGSVLLANQIVGDDAYRDRIHLLYDKGPLVLHALREEVGDDTFFTILKSFQRTFRGKPAYTRDLIGITNFITKRDLTPFFERYVLGTDVPAIKGR